MTTRSFIGRTPTKDPSMAALPEGQEFFTPAEIAKLLRLNRRTVLNLLANGTLAGIRAGRQWRVAKEDLEEFIRRRRGTPPDKGPDG